MRKTTLDNVILGGGNILESTSIERSVIGVRARIEDHTVVKNSIIMGLDRYETLNEIAIKKAAGYPPHLGIGKHCHIENAIIDKNCAIGNHVIIRGGRNLPDSETKDYCIRDGIIIIKEGSIIADNTIIGNPLKIAEPALMEIY